MKNNRHDPRIGPSHISLFGALIYMSEKQNRSTITAFSRDLMPLAKIASVTTYLKCLGDLKEGGYIKYHPSNDPVLGSEVELV
ncbi:MAG: hypothetical protein V4539_06585 [Bacteroidota bacterium]